MHYLLTMSKTNDTIIHSVLLSKLQAYGVTGHELSWLTDFLFNRRHVFPYNKTFSNSYPAYTGVPQGSVIGPLSFLIHFSDSYSSLKQTEIVKYADDTVIFTSSSEMNITRSNLSQDVNSLATWFARMSLS